LAGRLEARPIIGRLGRQSRRSHRHGQQRLAAASDIGEDHSCRLSLGTNQVEVIRGRRRYATDRIDRRHRQRNQQPHPGRLPVCTPRRSRPDGMPARRCWQVRHGPGLAHREPRTAVNSVDRGAMALCSIGCGISRSTRRLWPQGQRIPISRASVIVEEQTGQRSPAESAAQALGESIGGCISSTGRSRPPPPPPPPPVPAITRTRLSTFPENRMAPNHQHRHRRDQDQNHRRANTTGCGGD